jgi:hypothetical protein
MKRTALLPILLGFLVGFATGLYYAWRVNPVEYVQTAPASLRLSYKDDYLALIAAAYTSTGDLERARIRLGIFQESDIASALSELAQIRLAAGLPESEARALAQLAAALGERPTPAASPIASTAQMTPSPSGPTATATRTRPPPPTRTPTATPGAPFQLLAKEQLCDPRHVSPLLQIIVLDADGRGVQGVQIQVLWDTGQDLFYTGLKPELGIGFADFTMTPGVYYTLLLTEAETPVTGLIAEDCTGEDGSLFPGSWVLTFQQPDSP